MQISSTPNSLQRRADGDQSGNDNRKIAEQALVRAQNDLAIANSYVSEAAKSGQAVTAPYSAAAPPASAGSAPYASLAGSPQLLITPSISPSVAQASVSPTFGGATTSPSAALSQLASGSQSTAASPTVAWSSSAMPSASVIAWSSLAPSATLSLSAAMASIQADSQSQSSASGFWSIYDSHNKWFPAAVIATILVSLGALVAGVAIVQGLLRLPCLSRKRREHLSNDDNWSIASYNPQEKQASSRRGSVSTVRSRTATSEMQTAIRSRAGSEYRRASEPTSLASSYTSVPMPTYMPSPKTYIPQCAPAPLMSLQSSRAISCCAPVSSVSRAPTPMLHYARSSVAPSEHFIQEPLQQSPCYFAVAPRLPPLSCSYAPMSSPGWLDPCASVSTHFVASPTSYVPPVMAYHNPHEPVVSLHDSALRHSFSQASWYTALGPRPSNDAQQTFHVSSAGRSQQGYGHPAPHDRQRYSFAHSSMMNVTPSSRASAAPSGRYPPSAYERRRWERCVT